MALLVAVVAAGTGCATGYRVGAMPTVDTAGRAGVRLYVGGDFGLANREQEHALAGTLELGGSATGNPGTVGGTVGMGYDFQTVGPNVSGRIGPRGLFGLRTGPGDAYHVAGGGAAAVRFTLDESDWSYEMLAAELRVLVIPDDPNDSVDVEVGLGLAFERLHLGDFDLGIYP